MSVPTPTSAHSATGALLTALPASTIPTMVSRAASLHNSLKEITQKVENAYAGVGPTKTTPRQAPAYLDHTSALYVYS